MALGAPASVPTPFRPEGLLFDLLAVSLTGINVLSPVYDPAGELVDFAIEYLNPAAQRMTGLAERPGGTLLTWFPHIIAAGVLSHYRRVYEAGATEVYEVNYQADGLDNYFRLAPRRSGDWLIVSFTDTSDQDRSAVEQALRAAQAAEQAARAEAEAQRQHLYRILENFPAVVASYRGPEHVFELVSHRFQQDFPTRPIKGLPVRQALPELEGQQYYEILDGVYQTGEPFYGTELKTWVDLTGTGQLQLQYYNVCFQATRDSQGRIDGILNFAYDVTDAVLARQQLQQLNQELETRVQQRTEQLRHQQGLLSQIMRQVPAAIATLSGPEHRYTFFNDAYQALSGGRTSLERPVAEVFPEVVGQGFIGLLDQVYATGEPFIGTETPVQLFDAATGQPEPHYIDFIYQPLTDGQHQTQGILAFIVDVTDKVLARQQAEALQAQLLAAAQQQTNQRALLYQVFEQTPAAICIQRGPEHRFEYANAAYQQFFLGRDLLGKTAADAIPEIVDSGVLALLDHVYQTGETYYGYELPLLIAQPDGHPPRQMYFTFTYQAYRENGEIVGISTFAYNVAEQVQARQQQEAEQRQLHELFMQAPAPIVILDGPELVFQLVNPAYQLIFPGRELAGKPLLEALPELVGTPIPDLFRRVYQTGEPITVHELPLLQARHKGHAPEEIYWTFTYQARRAAHRLIDGVRVFAHDVTEQVRTRQRVQELNEKLANINQELAAINEKLTAANEELNETNAQLTRTNVDLDNFIYTASHDLKAPISNIEGLLLALEQELPAAGRVGQVPYMLALMQEATERFQRTILHLTDVSRLQQEHSQASEQVPLGPVIEAVCLDLLPLIQQTQAQLDVQVPPSLTLTCSEKNLRSVVYNLLSNALKYRHPDRQPLVRLSYQPQRDYQVLEVQDNGLGLDLTQNQDKLFAMFQRLHTHVEGTGIGLYMVKKIVENAGGRIEVESQLGQGTTFRVYFLR